MSWRLTLLIGIAALAACTLEPSPDGVALQFPEAQWAVTPGQSAVLYDGEVCLGGGVSAAVDTPL